MKITLKDGSIFEGTPGEYLEMIASLSEDTEELLEYGGDTYRKVTDRGAKEGDLEAKYFEKVKEESTEVDEGEALKVGDYAEVISKGEYHRIEYNVGDIVRLVEDDGSYIILFERLSDGLRNWVDKREVRKIDVTEYNGKKYVEVKRKAREGELIKIVNASTTFGEYGNGDVLVVKDVEQNAELGVDAEAIEVFILHEEYVVLEPLELAEEAPKSPFKIGDIVRGKPGQNRYMITNEDMERARVVHIRKDGIIGVEIQKHRTRKYVEGETFWGLEPEYFEKVPESYVTAKGGGGTVKITYADDATQTLVNVKSIEVDTEGAR